MVQSADSYSFTHAVSVVRRFCELGGDGTVTSCMKELTELLRFSMRALGGIGRVGESFNLGNVFHGTLEQRIYSAESDHVYLAAVLRDRAISAMWNGRYDGARVLFAESLNMYWRLPASARDKKEIAFIHQNLGELFFDRMRMLMKQRNSTVNAWRCG